MRLTLLLLATVSAHAAPLSFYIGTNTGGTGKSEGIYAATFDPATGAFTEPVLAAPCRNPNFLALHPSKPLLYAVGNTQTSPRGSVSVFRLGTPLEFLGESPSGGAGPCHLAINPSGTTLAVANYSSGSTATFPLDAEGKIGPAASSVKVDGSGPRADRQEGPHAHGVYFAGKDLLFVPDLGIDKVLAWQVDPATSTFTAHSPAGWAARPGAGPRHMAFSPDGKHAYVINELDNTVSSCTFDNAAGTLETLQESVPTLPEDWKGKNTTSEIAVHPDGLFVYASNRGHDSIAVFSRDPATGKLAPLQIAPCGGRVPRHFTISPDGRWLLCAHQDSGTISALPLDPATGKLGEPGPGMKVPNPVCILFVP